MTRDTDAEKGPRIPLLQGVLPIDRSALTSEIVAGLTLAALAIPEVMGYTRIAGTPVITGLYTLLVPMALFAVFGSSRHLVVGADSATAAILAAGLVGVAATGSDEYLALAGVLAFLAAAFLILARVLGLGFLADFLSRAVLVGFLTGVGVQVALGQIAGMLGVPGGGHGTIPQVTNDLRELGQTNGTAITISLVVLAIIVGSKRISRRIPGPLIAVVGALVASWALDLEARGVHLLGAIPSGLPHIALPQVDWSFDLIQRLVPTAFAMFVVILAQSAATSRAYASRYNERFSEDADLVGLGLANLGAGLSGTFVVNGSPTKTQMVDSAGGHSQLAQITTTLVTVLVLLFLTDTLAYMPDAVLSAIVFLIGVELIDVAGMRKIFAQRRSEFWVAAITTLTVVFVGVEQGILLAIVLSLVDHVRHGYRPKNAVLVRDAAKGWRAEPVATRKQAEPGLVIYRFTHSMYYANAEQLSNEVLDLVTQAPAPVSWLCLDGSAVDDVDFTAEETLQSLVGVLREKGVRLVAAQVREDVRVQGRRILDRQVSEDDFYETLDDVVAAYEGRGAARS